MIWLVTAMTVGAVVVLSRSWRARRGRKTAVKLAVRALAAYIAISLIAHVGGFLKIWPLQHPIFVIGIWSLSIVLIAGIVSFSRTPNATDRNRVGA